MGDRPMKDFFKSLAIKEASEKISSLNTITGRETKQELIEQESVAHYSLLDGFSIPGPHKGERDVTMQHFISVVLVKVANKKQACDEALSLDELIVSICEMSKDKSPEFDGLRCDFYKARW